MYKFIYSILHCRNVQIEALMPLIIVNQSVDWIRQILQFILNAKPFKYL